MGAGQITLVMFPRIIFRSVTGGKERQQGNFKSINSFKTKGKNTNRTLPLPAPKLHRLERQG